MMMLLMCDGAVRMQIELFRRDRAEFRIERARASVEYTVSGAVSVLYGSASYTSSHSRVN